MVDKGPHLPQKNSQAPRRKGKGPSVAPALIQKIKQAVNMVELVGEHVVLKKSGANWSGLCPFHNERTPSFSVHEQKQVYHCYGCKEGGDIVSFVMSVNGLSFAEAVEELASRAGIKLPDEYTRSVKGGTQNPLSRQAFKLNRFAIEFYRKHLARNDAFSKSCREYLEKRKINETVLRNFYVGAAPNDWDQLTRFLMDAKAPLDLAVKLGLIQPSKKQVPGRPAHFDLFRNRVIFPISDTRGRIVGVSGRLLDGEGPKYLNSPESFLYHKSKSAFGLFQAKKHIREEDEVILVEGQFDVMAMHQLGFENTIATCGTALTLDHIQMFQRLGKNITVLFDGDAAGQDAAEKAMVMGLQKGLVVKGAILPTKKDPNDLLMEGESGKEMLLSLIKGASPLLDQKIESTMSHLQEVPAEQQTQAKVDALKTVATWLKNFNDPIGRELRVQTIVERYGLSSELVHQAMGTVSAPKQAAVASPSRPAAPRPAK